MSFPDSLNISPVEVKSVENMEPKEDHGKKRNYEQYSERDTSVEDKENYLVAGNKHKKLF